MIKIAIVGPESTGKSELAKDLAAHFETTWVPEVARTFLHTLNRPYNREDVERIARLQVEEEEKKEKEANEILFCDTTLLVVKIWMENAFGSCPDWILESVEIRKYDLYLLPDIDLPWQPDPLREHPNQREFFLNWYVRELNRMKVNWKLISGNGIFRLKAAIHQVESAFL